MRRSRHRLAILVAVAALVLTACGGDGGDGGDSGTQGTTATTSAESRPESVERLRMAGGDFGYPSAFGWVRGPGQIQAGLIFDSLLWEDSTGDPIPWLAEEWSHSPDGLEWTFTIHDDATFHDGTPVTIDDVKFSFDYVLTGAGSDESSLGRDYEFTSIETEGTDTIVFTIAEPSATFEEDIGTSVFIIPQHIWGTVDDPAAFRGDQALVGSGPYKLASYDEAAGSYLYEAYEDFYLGTPYVKRLEFVPAPDELIALQRGEIDIAELSEDPVPPQQLEAFERNFAKLEKPGDWNLALHFNLAEGFPYDQVEFRQAVAYALDRQDMVDRILFGRGQPASVGGLAPTHEMGAQGLPTYDHDVSRANELLDDLGLVDTDGDGFRELADGSPWTQELQSSNRFSADGPELVKEYLREVGINVEVKILDRATADSNAADGNFTMALVGYGGLASDADNLRSRFVPGARSSFSTAKGYDNERVNQLAAEQAVTTDRAERRELVVEIQEIVAEEVPILPIYVPHRTAYYEDDVFTGWYHTPGCSPCRASRNKHMYVTGLETGFAN